MGRVARYKKAKQFQYKFGKEPDLLGPEGKNVNPKEIKQMPASLRRMILAQEKMKEIQAGKHKRKRGEEEPIDNEEKAKGEKDSDAAPDSKKQKTEEGNEDKPAEKIKFEGMRPNETYRQFVRRLREQTGEVLHAKAMEEKKGISQARKQKLKGKEEKRKQRKAAKKEDDGFAAKDSFKFGEVVQQPPSLTSKPKVRKPAAEVVASAMKQKQEQATASPKKKMTKEQKKEERERRKKMTEEEKEKEKEKEEKEARERRAKQLLLARVMENYKHNKDQKKQQLKEVDPRVKRDTVHYL